MPQFSSVPKFIFEEYIDSILNKKPVKKDEVVWNWSEVEFTDYNNLNWNDQNGIDWNLNYVSSYKQSLNTDSYIQTPKHFIVTKGGKHINAYAKTENEYKDIKLKFGEEYKDKNVDNVGDIYSLKFSENPYPVKNDKVKYTVIGDKYNFTVYDAFADSNYKTVNLSDIEKEVYLRKDNAFFNWYNSIDSYRGYINRHKLFTFLGELYNSGTNESEWKVNLVRHLFKDFVIRSVPENNRKEKFIRFLEIVFDQVYHKYYEYQKNLPSIIDYEETYPEFLDNIISIYNLPYTVYDYSDVDTLRRMARFSPVILKKKGSFASIVAAWRVMAGTDKNVENNEDITNYEWWIKAPEGSSTTTELSEYVPDTYYEIPTIREFGDLNKCTSSFYDRYKIDYDEFTENKILSPHYKIELDLSCRPPQDSSITTTKITSAYSFTDESEEENLFEIKEEVFSEKFADNTYKVFEDLRPITKKSHYNILFSLLSDFSGKKIPLYKKKYENIWWNSLCTVTQSLLGASIHRQLNKSNLWEIEHNLKTKEPIVQVVDINGNIMYPSRIYNETNHDIFKVYAEFEYPVTGYALVRQSDDVYKTFDGYNFISDIEKETIIQFYDVNRELYFPSEQTKLDQGLSIEDAEFGYVYLSETDLLWEQNTKSTEWIVNHNFISTGTLVQVYDEDWNIIFPESITLQDYEKCKITFSEPTKGKVILKEVGSLSIKDDIINKIKDEGVKIKIGDGKQILSSNYGIQNEVKTLNISPEDIFTDEDNNLFIEGKLNKEDKFNIREFAIYDNIEKNLYFYSQGNNIHKHEKFSMTLFYRINYDNLYIMENYNG